MLTGPHSIPPALQDGIGVSGTGRRTGVGAGVRAQQLSWVCTVAQSLRPCVSYAFHAGLYETEPRQWLSGQLGWDDHTDGQRLPCALRFLLDALRVSTYECGAIYQAFLISLYFTIHRLPNYNEKWKHKMQRNLQIPQTGFLFVSEAWHHGGPQTIKTTSTSPRTQTSSECQVHRR